VISSSFIPTSSDNRIPDHDRTITIVRGEVNKIVGLSTFWSTRRSFVKRAVLYHNRVGAGTAVTDDASRFIHRRLSDSDIRDGVRVVCPCQRIFSQTINYTVIDNEVLNVRACTTCLNPEPSAEAMTTNVIESYSPNRSL